jgi:hypothetical protein
MIFMRRFYRRWISMSETDERRVRKTSSGRLEPIEIPEQPRGLRLNRSALTLDPPRAGCVDRAMKRTAVAAGILMMAGAAPVAQARCAMGEMRPQAITARGARLPAGGGILVGYQFQSGEMDDDGLAPTWKLSRGKAAIATQVDTIAPGVVVYRPAKPVEAGAELTLADAAGHRQFVVTQGTDAGAMLPAPRPTAVHRHDELSYRWRSTREVIDVEAVPDDAYAVIVYDAHHTAISFHTVPHGVAGPTQVTALESMGHCVFPPAGQRAAADRESVTLAWVDRFGRVSPPSQPITVKADPPPSR